MNLLLSYIIGIAIRVELPSCSDSVEHYNCAIAIALWNLLTLELLHVVSWSELLPTLLIVQTD